MDTSSVGHFAALSFIVAPAMLTNATALMGLSSSNRLAIATQGKQNVVLSPMALVNCDTEVSCVAPARRPTYVSC